MLRKIRRKFERLTSHGKSSNKTKQPSLRLEDLERRVLLDAAGWWDELGFRGASGGGITENMESDPGEAQMVLSSDGDPIAFWVENSIGENVTEYVGGQDGSGRMPYHFETYGLICASQYGGDDLGWFDLYEGSSGGRTWYDPDEPVPTRPYGAIDLDETDLGYEFAYGKEIDVATGPNGEIAVTWVTDNNAIFVSLWDGESWSGLAGSTTGEGISGVTTSTNQILSPVAEKPSIAFSTSGEIFVSYTAVHPYGNQRDIVVKKYGYNYDGSQDNAPVEADKVWIELHSEDVIEFGSNTFTTTGGMTNDMANSYDSSIALTSEGEPLVVWTNAAGSNQTDIHMLHWDGLNWSEYGSHSASDPENDGTSGISNDITQSMQADIAVANTGEVVVTWVNWNNWTNYEAGGQAGIYVKVLHPDSMVWEAYELGSDTGVGIAAKPDALENGVLGAGWYYQPEVSLDSEGNPYIVWQGYGSGESRSLDRNDDGQAESPFSAAYGAYYQDGEFDILYSTDNVRGVASHESYLAWMPAGVITENDELIMAYTWRESVSDGLHHDNEIFVQSWDADAVEWTSYGRGSNSQGNDLVGLFSLADGDLASLTESKMGLIDYDNNATTETDVLVAIPDKDPLAVNATGLYLYNRQTGTWTDQVSTLPDGIGRVFDLRGEPEYEYQIQGPPLIAYVDDMDGMPYVYEWAGGQWSLVGNPADNGGAAGTQSSAALYNAGISVQAGPDGTIMVVYIQTIDGEERAVARIWDPDLGLWQDATEEYQMPTLGAAQVAYYADFTTCEFDKIGTFDEVSRDDRGNQEFEENGWYYWNEEEDPFWADSHSTSPIDQIEYVTDEVGLTVWFGPDEIRDSGLGIEYVFPPIDDETDEETTILNDDPGSFLASRVNSQFEVAEPSYYNIEFDYGLFSDAENIFYEVYLSIDGNLVDVNPNDNWDVQAEAIRTGTYDPAYVSFDWLKDETAILEANRLTYTTNSHYELDTKDIDLLLDAGEHTIEFQVFAVTDGTGVPNTDQEYTGYARFDNISIYQRIVDGGQVVGQQFDTDETTTAAPGNSSTWRLNDFVNDTNVDATNNSGHSTADWNINAGRYGVGDGVLELTLGDDDYSELDIAGSFDTIFNEVLDDEEHSILFDFSYRITTEDNIADDATVDLYLKIDDEIITLDDYQVVGGGEDTGWRHVTIDTYALSNAVYAKGEDHTIELGGSLSESLEMSDSTATILFDNIEVTYGSPLEELDIDQLDDWTFTGGASAVNGDGTGGGDVDSDNIPTNGFVMELTDDAGSEDDVEGYYEYTLTLTDSRYVVLDLDFMMEVDADLAYWEYMRMMVDVDGTDVTELGDYNLFGGGATDGVQVWDWTHDSIELGELAAGAHTIRIKGILRDVIDGADAGTGELHLDNIYFHQYAGSGEHRSIAEDGAGATGGNETVGPIINTPDYVYDDEDDTGFQANLYMETIAADGVQTFVIEDVEQYSYGEMEVLFRYHTSTGLTDSTDLRILIDGEPYEINNERDSDNEASATSMTWSYPDQNDPAINHYIYKHLTVDRVLKGTHTVTIEISGTSTMDLWVDNVTVLTSEQTDALRPIVTLGANRNFVVGVTNNSTDVGIYSPDDTEVYADGVITNAQYDMVNHEGLSFGDDFIWDGYTMAVLYEYDDGDWQQYGSNFRSRTGIDFLGVGSDEASTLTPMPSNMVHTIADVAIGANQYEWLIVEDFGAEFVDTNGDGDNDAFEIHPWLSNNPAPYWNENPTYYMPHVYRWSAGGDPLNSPGTGWTDTGLPIKNDDGHATGDDLNYTHIQLIGSSGQQPVVSWQERGARGSYEGASAMRWEDVNTWGLLGAGESVQNTDDAMWSATKLSDMISSEDGDPIVFYYMVHFDTYGIREFKHDYEIPELIVNEGDNNTTDLVNDNIIEFGQTRVRSIDKAFTLSNSDATLGELYIYDILIGGYGELDDSPFEILGLPDTFPDEPIVIEPGDNWPLLLRFDPETVPVGEYSATMLIYSNDVYDEMEDGSHYTDVALNVEVIKNDELIEVSEGSHWLNYEDAIIYPEYDPADSTTWNGGGARNLEGQFIQEFDVSAAGDVLLDFDYRLMLGDRLTTDDYVLDMIVSVDGVDVTVPGDYRIQGDILLDTLYQNTQIVLEDLSSGVHTIGIRGELTKCLGGVGGTGIIQLDNIKIGDDPTYDFYLDPGDAEWLFVDDTVNPESSAGDWEYGVGVENSGLEMTLGIPLEVEQVVIENKGKSAVTIQDWFFDGTAYRFLEEGRDGTAGIIVSHRLAGGNFTDEEVSVTNTAIVDAGLEMILGNRGNDQTDLTGAFSHTFTLDDAGVTTMDFSYQLLKGDALANDATLTLYVEVDGTDVQSYTYDAGNLNYKDVAALSFGNLAAGSHTVKFRAELSESVADAEGVGILRLDDITIGDGKTHNFAKNTLGIDWTFEADPYEAANGVTNPLYYRVQGQYNLSAGSESNGDDIILNPGDYLTLMVIFEPREIGTYDEMLYIHTDTEDMNVIPVRMTGAGVGGANIVVSYDGEVMEEGTDVIDFGSVIRGTTDSVTVTIANNGSTDLTLLNAYESNDVINLQLTPYIENVVLEPGEQIDLVLEYSPSVGEGAEANEILTLDTALTILSDDAEDDDKIFTLEVVALAVPEIPIIELIESDTGDAYDVPARLEFGSSYIGQMNQKTFVIKNTGGSDLTLEGFQWDTTTPFTVSPPNLRNDASDDLVLAMGETTTITVTFDPDEAGLTNIPLRVYYYNENGVVEYDSTSTIRLVGQAVGQLMSVEDVDSDLVANGGSLDFDTRGVGRDSISETIYIKNEGTSDLTITNWAISNATSAGVYSLITTFDDDVILAPNTSYPVEVAFTPDGLGEFDGVLTIESDDPNNSSWVVNLDGEGVTPGAITSDILLVDFGSQAINEAKTETIIIENTGSDYLTVTDIELAGALSFFSWSAPDLEGDAFVMAPGSQYEISVTFKAYTGYDSTTQLLITADNYTDNDPVVTSVNLTATALATATYQDGKYVLSGENGEVIKVTIKNGTFQIVPMEDNLGIARIVLTDSDSSTVLKVVGPSDGARIGQISGGIVKSIYLKNITLDGDLDDNGLFDKNEAGNIIEGDAIDIDEITTSLILGNVVDGADITVGSAPSGKLKIVADQIGNVDDDVDINIGGIVKSFTATSFNEGNFTADEVGSFKIKYGDFDAVVNVNGDLDKLDIKGIEAHDVNGRFYVDGDISKFTVKKQTFSGIVSANMIKSIQLNEVNKAAVIVKSELSKVKIGGNMIDSLILAGYDIGDDNVIGGLTSDDAAVSGGVIGSVKVKGNVGDSYVLAGIKPDNVNLFEQGGFANIDVFDVFNDTPDLANMRTAEIGKVKFGGVMDSNDTFGVATYAGSIKYVKVGRLNVTEASPWDQFQVDVL